MSSEVETSLDVSEIVRDSSTPLGMTKVERLRDYLAKAAIVLGSGLNSEVAGFSCLTNLAAGISIEKLSHEEVLKTRKTAAANFDRLLKSALAEL